MQRMTGLLIVTINLSDKRRIKRCIYKGQGLSDIHILPRSCLIGCIGECSVPRMSLVGVICMQTIKMLPVEQ